MVRVCLFSRFVATSRERQRDRQTERQMQRCTETERQKVGGMNENMSEKVRVHWGEGVNPHTHEHAPQHCITSRFIINLIKRDHR